MTIVKPPRKNDDGDEHIAEGWIHWKFQLSRKTIAWLLGAISIFGSGVTVGSIFSPNPVPGLTPPDTAQPQLEFCIRRENGDTLCFDRDRES